MTALTTRDALNRELQRHIGAHADIVANALLASGAVIDAATLADDEAAFDAVVAKMRSQVGSTRADRVREVFDALAAALTERAQ